MQEVFLNISGVKMVCACWPHMKLTHKRDNSEAPNDLNQRWRWLWDNCDFNPVELAQLTGLKEDVLFALDAAIGNKLIYPDGSISSVIKKKILLKLNEKKSSIFKGLTER